jgi:hypothetical protein
VLSVTCCTRASTRAHGCICAKCTCARARSLARSLASDSRTHARTQVTQHARTRLHARTNTRMRARALAGQRSYRATARAAAARSPASAAACRRRTRAVRRRRIRPTRGPVGAATAAAAPQPLGSPPCPHLRRDWARPCPHLRRDWARPCPHLRHDWASRIVTIAAVLARRRRSRCIHDAQAAKWW